MSEQIQMGKQYRTRDGCETRVVCVDANDPPYHVVFLKKFKDGRELPYIATKEGCALSSGVESKNDLIEVKPRIKRKVWLNVYPDSEVTHTYGNYFFSKESADDAATATRIACVPVNLDVEEGHGL